MVQLFRNPLIGIALGIAAILAAALLDGAFQYLLPSVSDLRVGQTNLATCVVMFALAVAFLVAGYCGKSWRVACAWVLLPVVALYVGAAVVTPYAYTCDPVTSLWWCALTHSPFIASIVACCSGYVVNKSKVSARHVV